jgi:hypothetical protein
VLDLYKVHCAEEVKSTARQLNIELIYIPPGMTDACQPLDRAVFGVVKAKAKKLFREHFFGQTADQIRMQKALAARLLMQCWEEVSPEVLARAWCIYNPDDG